MKTRVLLIEDEDMKRSTISFHLDNIYDEVVCSQNEIKIIELLQKDNFDLIVCPKDFLNKSLDEFIKNRDFARKVIIISEKNNKQELVDYINKRVYGYYQKPLNIDVLMKVLLLAKEKISVNPKVIKIKKKVIYKINKNFSFDKTNRYLYENRYRVNLSKRESNVICLLLENIGNIMSLGELKKKMDTTVTPTDLATRTMMTRIKRKVGSNNFIQSRRGYGYFISDKIAS